MSQIATIVTDQNRITTFEDTVNSLAPALAGSKFSVWIYFKAGDLEIDTRKKDTNFFMSCNNRKNGSGQANSFSVCIAYVPTVNSPDVNYIDMKLYGPNAKAGYQSYKDTSTSSSTVAVMNECILQYGYNELNVFSPRYVGQLLDYKVEIQNGMLIYTMTGYSGCVSDKENKHNFEQIGSINYEGDTPSPEGGKRPTEVAAEAFKKYLPGYSVEIDSSAQGKDKAVVIGAKNDSTVFDYVREVLALAEDESSGSNADISSKSIYYFTITDIEGSKKITIKRTNPETDSSSAKANVIFDWMGGFGNNTNINTGNLVQNFMTEFKGAVALNAIAKKNDAQNPEDEYAYSINSYGEVVSSKMFIGDAYSGDFLDSDASKNLSAWASATQYAYKATLTTVGLPCEIPIGEYIRVRPLIYGREHMTGGVYMITGSEDNVDNNGFTTTISLVKIGT